MSAKKSRFEQLQVLNPTPAPEIDVSGERTALESLSTQMRRDLKIALKQASAREERKQYQLLEDAVTDYLGRIHPDILK